MLYIVNWIDLQYFKAEGKLPCDVTSVISRSDYCYLRRISHDDVYEESLYYYLWRKSFLAGSPHKKTKTGLLLCEFMDCVLQDDLVFELEVLPFLLGSLK